MIGRLRRLTGRRRASGAVEPWAPEPAAGLDVGEPAGDLAPGLFVNAIAEGADPSVVRDGDRYLWCQSEGNVAVAIWESDRLNAFGRRHVVWRAPRTGPVSREVWAPELIRLDGRWHIYFAASDGRNRTHLSYVLVARTDDPLGDYELHGPLFTGDEPGGENRWAIDLTVLEHGGSRYAIWSGWPTRHDDLQHLYIAAMDSPTQLAGGRVRIADAGAYDWERILETADSRGLLEAPQVLNHGGRTFVVYSCAASWLPTYKLGMLELVGADPLDPQSWHRFAEPVFTGDDATFGVGHGSFLTTAGDRDWWHVYHAKVDRRDGWRRVVHVQPMEWADDGTPQLGAAVPRGRPLPLPSGTPDHPRRDAREWDLTGPDSLADFDYYGHHQFLAEKPDGVHLGVEPAIPVNAFRCGEKLLLRDGAYADLEMTAGFTFAQDHRAAGVLFRCSAFGIGYDAQRGYFAGVARDRSALVVGRTDGVRFLSLAETELVTDVGAPLELGVTARGPDIQVSCGPARLRVRDQTYTSGTVGLRVVDTHTCFTWLDLAPLR